MKYLFILCICLSCSLPSPTGTKEEIFDWIDDNYQYAEENKEYWQTPNETLERMTGDCEDWAILCVYMLNVINIPARIALVNKPDWETGYLHAAIEIDGLIYETRGGRDITTEYIVQHILTYSDMMFLRIFNI